MAKHRYFLSTKPSYDGPLIVSWYEIQGAVGKEVQEDAATYFAMSLAARVNGSQGPMLVKSDIPWTIKTMQAYLRTLTPAALKAFITEASVRPDNLPGMLERKPRQPSPYW